MTYKRSTTADVDDEVRKILTGELSLDRLIALDHAGDSEMDRLIASMFGDHGELRMRCGALYSEWCQLPSVTLEQGCLLLLEHNPAKPADKADPMLNLPERFYHLKNRLEIEVGVALKPIKHYVPGMPRRFHLGDVVRVAGALGLQSIASAVLTEMVSSNKDRGSGSTATAQRRRVDERMNFHRAVVDHLLKRNPPMAFSIPPKAKASKRRKFTGAPVNVEVRGLDQKQYCAQYRKLFAEMKNRPGYNEPESSLVDDCRALNIAFAEGRPKGTKDKKKRRRAGGR